MPHLQRGQPHSHVEDVVNLDTIAEGVPIGLWLMKVPAELSPRNTIAGAASVMKLDTKNKHALKRTLPWNEWSHTIGKRSKITRQHKRKTNCHQNSL